MRKLLLAPVVFALCLLQAFAQDEPTMPRIAPAETYTCTYNEGMGPADLDAAVESFNKWADEHDVNDYYAFTLTPWFTVNADFDFAWIGAWTDGNAMGAGTDLWLDTGGEAAMAFFGLADCNAHEMWATMTVREAPDDRSASDRFVIQFQDCSVPEGKTMGGAFAAMDKWTSYMDDNGYMNAVYVMFQAAGGGKEDYDFKLVDTWANHTNRGRDFEAYAMGGGEVAHAEAMAGTLACDTGRVYNAAVRRRIKQED